MHPSAADLLSRCAALLAEGQPLEPERIATLFGMERAVLGQLARVAYPLSASGPAEQFVARDLVMLASRRASAEGVEAALGAIGHAASRPDSAFLSALAGPAGG